MAREEGRAKGTDSALPPFQSVGLRKRRGRTRDEVELNTIMEKSKTEGVEDGEGEGELITWLRKIVCKSVVPKGE
jgi:hypothetical protein